MTYTGIFIFGIVVGIIVALAGASLAMSASDRDDWKEDSREG